MNEKDFCLHKKTLNVHTWFEIYCHLRDAVHSASLERYAGVEQDMAARLPLEVMAASHRVEVVTLHVVGLHPPLHRHDGGQGPQVSSALT